MSRKHKQLRKKMKFLIKCPWCGKLVGISSSRNLLSHIVVKGKQYVGVGQPVKTIQEYWKRERINAKDRNRN